MRVQMRTFMIAVAIFMVPISSAYPVLPEMDFLYNYQISYELLQEVPLVPMSVPDVSPIHTVTGNLRPWIFDHTLQPNSLEAGSLKSEELEEVLQDELLIPEEQTTPFWSRRGVLITTGVLFFGGILFGLLGLLFGSGSKSGGSGFNFDPSGGGGDPSIKDPQTPKEPVGPEVENFLDPIVIVDETKDGEGSGQLPVIPEPSTFLLLAAGFGLALLRKQKG